MSEADGGDATPSTSTTTAPSTTTTAPSTTTTAPSTTTTAPSTTTTAPSTTTTAPSTTTTAPSTTTTAPSTTTTAPSTTTTAPSPTTTSALPSVDEFRGAPKEDDGQEHLPDSLQVEAGATVVLNWTVSNAADGVELTDSTDTGNPKKFGADTTSTEVMPQVDTQDYDLVAVAGEARSDPKRVHVSTHAPGELVSPHAEVTPPDGGWFELTLVGDDGKPLSNAQVDIYHQGSLARTVTLDESGYAKVEGLPAADRYEIEIAGQVLALLDDAPAPDDTALA